MSDSDSEEEARRQLVRMVRTYRRERTRTLEFARYIPELMHEFFLDEITFLDRFGLDPFEFEELHTMLEGKILRSHSNFRDNIGTRERLAICLRFLSSGDSMQELSRHYGIPYSTVPIMIREVCRTISRHLMPMVMPTPTQLMWERNAREFKRRYEMPNCIGALEGKNLFVNGHKIVLLAIVDARDRFVMVDVGNYRSNCFQGNVLDKSRLGKSFLRNEFHVPDPRPITANSEPLPFMILASSFFPSKPYVMTKYSRPECAMNPTHRVFNTRLSRAKVTVNRALMRLRSKWGVFQGPLTVQPEVVESVVQACCCLYNFFVLRMHQPPFDEPDEIVAITEDRLNSLLQLMPQESLDIRDKFKAYFLSAEGQVPWQWHDVMTSSEDS